MPECKVWGEPWGCGGRLIRTDWLPSSGEDPLLREYKCENCGQVTYMKTGRLQKVRSNLKENTEQGVLL